MTRLQGLKKVATIRVWDPVVRLFHWTLVFAFSYNYVVQSPRSTHRLIGYVVLAAIALRLVWGFVGTKHARFRNFVPGPSTFLRHIRDVGQGREQRHIGHNPAGGAMIVAMIAMLLLIGLSGWSMGLDMFRGDHWVEEAHEICVNIMLILVIFHIGGVVWESWRHQENLIVAMVTGKKRV